jgi:hypothetical protein
MRTHADPWSCARCRKHGWNWACFDDVGPRARARRWSGSALFHCLCAAPSYEPRRGARGSPWSSRPAGSSETLSAMCHSELRLPRRNCLEQCAENSFGTSR